MNCLLYIGNISSYITRTPKLVNSQYKYKKEVPKSTNTKIICVYDIETYSFNVDDKKKELIPIGVSYSLIDLDKKTYNLEEPIIKEKFLDDTDKSLLQSFIYRLYNNLIKKIFTLFKCLHTMVVDLIIFI
jgi:hypothetical protein